MHVIAVMDDKGRGQHVFPLQPVIMKYILWAQNNNYKGNYKSENVAFNIQFCLPSKNEQKGTEIFHEWSVTVDSVYFHVKWGLSIYHIYYDFDTTFLCHKQRRIKSDSQLQSLRSASVIKRQTVVLEAKIA